MINFRSDSDPILEQSLQVLLGAVPAAELAWISSYEDLQAEDLTLITQTGLTTNTTPVVVVDPPPEESDVFQLKSFYTKNQNVAAVTFIVQYNDNATLREMLRVTLSQDDTLVYEQAEGWRVLDSLGRVKIVFTLSDLGIIAQVNPSAATLTDGLTVPTGFQIQGHVNVCNRSGTGTTMRISIAPNGAADDNSQYLVYDLPISGGNVYDSSTIIADALDVIRVYATLATLTFSIFAQRKPA